MERHRQPDRRPYGLCVGRGRQLRRRDAGDHRLRLSDGKSGWGHAGALGLNNEDMIVHRWLANAYKRSLAATSLPRASLSAP